MLRRLVVVATLAISLVALGAPSAGAVTLPPGDGNVSCAVSGSAKIVRSKLYPDRSKLKLVASISGCSYNGTAIPFVGGISRTVASGDPAQWCNVLTQGGSLARSVTKVTVFGTTYTQIAVNVTLAPAVPSGSGSALSFTGTLSALGVTVAVNGSLQTAVPITDLCAGATVPFTGTVGASWVRA